MAILKNARHERFCQEVAKGKTADEAYRIAGFKAHSGNASRLRGDESISGRIAEILANASQKTEVTLESLSREADALQAQASALGQVSAAVGALKLKAVFAGLYVEKAENTNKNSNLADLPDDKLNEIAAKAEPIEPEPAVVPPLDPAPRDEHDPLN